MVFNLIIHLIYYSTKGVLALALIWWAKVTAREDILNKFPPDETESSAADRTMKVAARRQRSDVKKLFITFAISFTLIHQIVSTIMAPPAPAPVLVAENVKVNVEKQTFRIKDIKIEVRKDVHYYMHTFGVLQTIEGNGEENLKMRIVASAMEDYLKTWIETYNHVESLKEKCINRHDKCVFWTSIGECKKNPGYMENDCMLACGKCEKLLETSYHPKKYILTKDGYRLNEGFTN